MTENIQLFCLPFAGGGADAFQGLAKELEGENIEIVTFEYAGHGTRRMEEFYPDFDSMVSDAAEFIAARRKPDAGYALLGYSMGSVVTYELMAQSRLSGTPEHIFLAAHEAPDVEWPGKAYYDLKDEEFLETLKTMGGFEKLDEKTLNNRFFQKLYLKPIREDYRLLAMYQMSKAIVLPAETTMFYATGDIPTQAIRKWDPFFGPGSEYISIGENHFFIRDHAKEMAAVIKAKLF